MATNTWKRRRLIYHTITSAEAIANAAAISIVSGGSSDDFAFMGQILRSNTEIPGFSWTYASGTGDLTLADAGSADLTEDDAVKIIGTFV